MKEIVLNAEWSQLMRNYRLDHQHPMNQKTHSVGIPLIVFSIPVGLFFGGFKAFLAMFVVGWIFQFVGHHYEGKKPSFAGDWRYLFVGVIWWSQKHGLRLFRLQDENGV